MRGLYAQTRLSHNTQGQQRPLTFRKSSGVCSRVPLGYLKAASSPAITSLDAEPPRNSNHVQSAQLEVPESIAEPMSEEVVVTEQQRHRKLWFAAIKPPMYTVSIIPVLVSDNIVLLCFHVIDCISVTFI